MASIGIYEFATISKCVPIGKSLKINYQDHGHGRSGFFNIETSEFFHTQDSESEGNGFTNDLDGGPTFWSHNHDDEYFYQNIFALELIENREFYVSQTARDQEKKLNQ